MGYYGSIRGFAISGVLDQINLDLMKINRMAAAESLEIANPDIGCLVCRIRHGNPIFLVEASALTDKQLCIILGKDRQGKQSYRTKNTQKINNIQSISPEVTIFFQLLSMDSPSGQTS